LHVDKEIIDKYGDINNSFNNCNKSTADHSFRLLEKHFPSIYVQVHKQKKHYEIALCTKNDVK